MGEQFYPEPTWEIRVGACLSQIVSPPLLTPVGASEGRLQIGDGIVFVLTELEDSPLSGAYVF